MSTDGERMGVPAVVALCVLWASGCGGSGSLAPTAGATNEGLDRAVLALHLAHLAEVVQARCPERSMEAIGDAYDRGLGRLQSCGDPAAYDHVRAWLDALASEPIDDEARLWGQQRDQLTRSFVGVGTACEAADPDALRAALERAIRLHGSRDSCERCGPMQSEMLTALALEVLRQARARTWSRQDELGLVRGMRVFSLMDGPLQFSDMLALVSDHAEECELIEATTPWAARETWVEGTLLGSSATVSGPPLLFAPAPLGFEGAIIAVYSARTSLAGVASTLASHFQPSESEGEDESGAVWFEGVDGNSVALVLPGDRQQRSDDHLVIVAGVSPMHEEAELVAEGVLDMLASARRASDTPALPGVPVLLEDPSLPWLAHVTVLIDMWLYAADPFAIVPGQPVEGVSVMRGAAQPPCEVPSGFTGTASETTVFGTRSCAMFTQRASAPEGPWTHTLSIPQRDGTLVVAQTISGDHDTALARALARIPLMRLATP